MKSSILFQVIILMLVFPFTLLADMNKKMKVTYTFMVYSMDDSQQGSSVTTYGDRFSINGYSDTLKFVDEKNTDQGPELKIFTKEMSSPQLKNWQQFSTILKATAENQSICLETKDHALSPYINSIKANQQCFQIADLPFKGSIQNNILMESSVKIGWRRYFLRTTIYGVEIL